LAEAERAMNQAGIQLAIQNVMPQAIATGLFVSLCTIQEPDSLFMGAGQPSGNFVNVAGFVNIPCMAPPLSDVRIQAEEKNAEEKIEVFSPLHVLLNGYYPGIEIGTGQGWRAIVDGQAMDLLGAEHDSQSQMTRLAVRIGIL